MKKEYLIAIALSTFVILVSNLSFFVPYLNPKNNLEFLGRHAINSGDTYTYLSTIEQVREGRILVENQYTSEPQSPRLLRPSFILIGTLARWFNLSSLAAYHTFRTLFSTIFFLVLYKFLEWFFDTEKKRLTAFAIVLTASGLGFLLGRFFPSTIDLWIPEAITWLSLAEAPQFMLSLGLLLAGYLFFLKYLKTQNDYFLVPMTLVFFALSLEHPFDVVVVTPVLFLSAWWNRQTLVKSLGIAAAAGCGLLYQLYEVYQNPILKAWSAQNVLISPAPINYLVGFGLIFIFGLIGLKIFFEEQKPQQKLLLVWVGVTAIALFAPVAFQRRMIEGVHIPLAIAATAAIFAFPQILKSKLAIPLLVLALSLSSLATIYKDFQAYAADPVEDPYYYIKRPDLDGILWLKAQSTFNNVILANQFFGNLIPGIAGRKVYLGHRIQTINFNQKIALTNSFLLENDESKAKEFLKQGGITYIFLGINDSMLGYGFKPDEKNYLTKVYEKDGTSIYKVSN